MLQDLATRNRAEGNNKGQGLGDTDLKGLMLALSYG